MPSKRMTVSVLIALTLVLALGAAIAPEAALACPNCKDAVADTDTGLTGVARGYGISILFMISLPFSLLGFLGFILWRASRHPHPMYAGRQGPSAP